VTGRRKHRITGNPEDFNNTADNRSTAELQLQYLKPFTSHGILHRCRRCVAAHLCSLHLLWRGQLHRRSDFRFIAFHSGCRDGKTGNIHGYRAHKYKWRNSVQLRPADLELAAAALLHDIGHLLGMEAGTTMLRILLLLFVSDTVVLPGLQMQMDGCGILDHEGLGADFLCKLGFSSRVQKLVFTLFYLFTTL
jgi:hypothetical protein